MHYATLVSFCEEEVEVEDEKENEEEEDEAGAISKRQR